MALPKRTMISVEEYFQLDEDSYDARYEYIDGELRMLAGGTTNHGKISINIATVLSNALSEGSCSVYSSDVRVQLSASRYVYPDVTVACDEEQRGDDKMLLHPRLVVEVLSPSTRAYDRDEKFTFYRECSSIQEYVMVNTERPFIEVFRRGNNHFWTYHTFEPGEEVELASLDVRFPVMKVYRKVKFPDPHAEKQS